MHMLDHSCILGINPIWSCWMILLMYCQILLIFCWGILKLCSSRILDYNFFSYTILFWFWYQGHAGSIKWVWKCFLFFGRVWERLVFSKCLVELASEAMWSWTFFLEGFRLLIYYSLSYQADSLFCFFMIESWWVVCF